jgi:predicted butyrate kinase (DUF1464 family)
MTKKTVLGIDPGSKSWDFIGLNNNHIILDTSIPTKDLIRDPYKCITIIKSLDEREKIDLMVAPSGFGLPLRKSSELTKKDIFLTLLKFQKEEKEELVGLGKILKLIQHEKIPGIIVPGVKHLPTVPRFRKINKIDMGTADKLCTTVVGIKDQMESQNIPPEQSNFIMVEIGYGFTAVVAVENGKIIDGIGGSNIMGFRACGSLDGELAYLIKEIKKKNIYKGGVAYIAGYADLSLREISLLAEKDSQTNMAFQAYVSSVKKAVYAISSSFSENKKELEILLAGRGAEIKYIKKKITNALNAFTPVRLMKTYSQIAKRAAQGAAYIANGLLGEKYAPIVANLELKGASGSVLDDIFIPFKKLNLNSDA